MLDVVFHLLHLVLDGSNALVHRLSVELGDFAHRFLYQLKDVVHDNLATEQVLKGLHLLEHVLQLLFPRFLILLKDFIDSILEEYPFQRVVMPFVFKFTEPDFQLSLQKVSGVVGVVDEYVLDRKELRLVVHDDASIRGDVAFAVGECVKSIYGLVRRHVVREVDYDVHLIGGHVFDFLDLDFPLVLCLQDGVFDHLRGLPIRDFRYGDSILVDFIDFGADFHASASGSVLVIAAIGIASCREVRINREILALENVYRGIKEFIEIVRQYFGCHSHGNSFRALSQEKRKSNRKLGRLLIATVVGGHPVGDFRVEDNFLREFAQSSFYVTRSGVGVACQYIAPVSLAVNQ